jgi:hypothetical protein
VRHKEIKDEPFLFVRQKTLPTFAQHTRIKAGVAPFSSSQLFPIETPTNRIGCLTQTNAKRQGLLRIDLGEDTIPRMAHSGT